MLKTERVGLLDQYSFTKKGLTEILKQLDSTNIRILSAMWKFGPRNLLEVSRRTEIPFTSVYHRISRIESKLKEIAFLNPQVAKLGMVRVVVLVTATPGHEDEVTSALKMPNLWRSIGFCEGTFTHRSVQLVPIKYLREFKAYIQHLALGILISRFEIIYTGDSVANFPEFEYYDPDANHWTFDWEGWMRALAACEPTQSLNDPQDYKVSVDKKDILLIEELEIDARKSFAELAPLLGMTPQGVKHHYDKLVSSGIAGHFQFRVVPYPIELSAYHEIMLEFNNKNNLDGFFSLVRRLFWVVGVVKVLRRNALVIQTYMLDSQLSNMFSFFSQMCRAGMLNSFSAVRIDYGSRQTQTISGELFGNEKGWVVDFENCSAELSKLIEVRPLANKS